MNKKRILAVLLALVITGGSVFGVAQIAKAASRSTVMVLPVSSINYGRWWYGGGSQMEGIVTADASQNVYLTATQSVEKVCVKEGQAVREGDLLMIYDTQQTGLNLEKEKLSREQTLIRIEVAKKNIETLKKIRPIAEGGGGEFVFPEDPGFYDEPGPEVEPIKAALHTVLDDKAEPYNMTGEEETWGTEENPLRYLCRDGSKITASFLETLKKKAKGKDLYYMIEIREGDRPEGALIKAWTENARKIGEVDPNWEGVISLAGEVVITPTPTDEPGPTDIPGPTDEPTPTDIPGPTDEPTPTDIPGPTDEPTPTDIPAPTGEPAPTDIPAPTVEPDPTDIPAPTGGPAPTDTPDMGIDSNTVDILPAGEKPGPVIKTLMTGPLSNTGILSLVTSADPVQAYLLAAEGGEGRGLAEAVGLIPSDAEYTADDLKRALADEELTLRALELDLREADLKIASADKAVGDGSVKAKMNGIVKKAGDPENPNNDGTPFIEVTAAEGLYVRSALNERAYGHVKEGDAVTITSWQSGMTYDGVIREISTFPDTSGMFGYGTSETYYPMTISVPGNSDLTTPEWVQVSLDPGSMEGNEGSDPAGVGEAVSGDGSLTIPKAFIRDEDGGKYVYIRGEDDKLVRSPVTTGPLQDESYEILSGLSNDDWIAFPYGKSVKEGARVREGTMEELYES